MVLKCFYTAQGRKIMKIKICGLTSPSEADYLNKNSVDFAGMVMFFPASRRNISPLQARAIRNELSESIKTVAVTVSPSFEEIGIIAGEGFDYVQIHGQIPPEMFLHPLLPVFKAFNVSDTDQYSKLQNLNFIAGYVFDAPQPGSGKTFDWQLLREIPRDGKLLILAGGLNPANVADAVRIVRPDMVDVSSGVELPEGGKDRRLIEEFVTNARS